MNATLRSPLFCATDKDALNFEINTLQLTAIIIELPSSGLLSERPCLQAFALLVETMAYL
jgi:hypothetical protein